MVLRTEGPQALIGKVAMQIGDHAFDLRYDVDTCRWASLTDLDVAGTQRRHGVDYEPTGGGEFSRLMRDAPIPRSGAFLDLGAGKGRVLLMASRLGFDRVVGVDLAEELCAVARTNAATFRRKVPDAAPIDIVCSDASTYAIDEDVTVVFLFNPFDEHVLGQVMDRIDESLSRRQRPLYVIYNNPRHTSTIEKHPFSLVGRYRYPRAPFAVYRSEPVTG